MIKVIIFDFDDTLVESTVNFMKISRQIAGDMGLREPEEQEFINFGDSWEDFILRTWPGVDLELYKAKYKVSAEKIIYRRYPGVNTTLKQLKGRFELYILTKRPRDFMEIRIRQSGLDISCIKEIFANEDLNFQKPDPRTFDVFDPYLSTIHKSEVAYVGDHLDDMRAAKGAGFHFIGVQTGFFKKADFANKGLSQDHVLDSMDGLPAVIDSL